MTGETSNRRRACQHCGEALTPAERNRRYHVRCAEAARQARQRANSARYRARQVLEPEVPEDFKAGRVRLPGVVLPGADSMAIRAVAARVSVSARTYHASLRRFRVEEVVTSPQFLALRGFTDDVLQLCEVLDDVLPIPQVRTDTFDAAEGTDHLIRRLTVKPRTQQR